MSDVNKVNEEVANFDKQKLKKTETQEKSYVPTAAEIEAEKKALESGK